jgi:hypothetical protein
MFCLCQLTGKLFFLSPALAKQFSGKAGWDTAVAAMMNLPSSAEYQVKLLS